MTSAVPQLEAIVDVARQITEQLTPGSVVPLPMFESVAAQEGFGLTTGVGAVLLYGDVTHAEPSTWSLQCSAAVAFDVPHHPDVGRWVNEQNRTSVLGTYYYAVTPDRRLSAVIWEMHVWSRLLDDLSGMAGQGTIHWVAEILRAALHTSATEATGFVQQFGGRVMEPTEDDLMTLFVASSG